MYRECYLCGEKLTQEEIENYKDCCAGCWIDEYAGDPEQEDDLDYEMSDDE